MATDTEDLAAFKAVLADALAEQVIHDLLAAWVDEIVADAKRVLAAQICRVLRVVAFRRRCRQPDVADRFWSDYLADYARRLDRQIMGADDV